MPKVADIPKALKALAFHGVDFLDYDQDQVPANCPFCSKRKFFARRDTGVWDCKVCGRTGNPQSFLVQMWEESAGSIGTEFTKDRSVLDQASLLDIGVRRSMIDEEVIVPSYGADGKIDNLCRYTKDYKTGKRILYSTPDFHQGIFGGNLYDKNKKTLYIVEGPWKVAVLRELLARTKKGDAGSISLTGNVGSSMLADANVLGVPGCNTWHDSWDVFAAGKDVVICFDNDHPREVDKRIIPPAGWNASRTLTGKLLRVSPAPESISVLQWGNDGYDENLPSGYDIRDAMKHEGKEKDARARVNELGAILSMVVPKPDDWTAAEGSKSDGSIHVNTIDCRSWPDLVKQWKKALLWSDGLDRTLSVMMASILSTDMMDAQLWIKIISPPSTGKTQLCDAIGTARKRVRSVGNFTGLHSGFQTDAEGEEDHSLLSQIKDMTLVVKDADTILKSPSREKILSQIRDAYDTNCAVAFGNRVKREYHNHRFTTIFAGTEALLEMDSADLGARFLDCIIMTGIDTEVEMDVNKRGFHRIYNNRGSGTNGSASSQSDSEISKVKAMTGGYVEYLRDNAASIRAGVTVENIDAIQDKISYYAQFIAFARARPSKTQDEATTREMSARVNEQLSKLAICLAGAMGKKTIDKEVMRRVRQVTLDTARGRACEMMRELSSMKNGMETQHLATKIHYGLEETRALLRFFRSIEGVELFEVKVVGKNGAVGAPRWRLTPKMREIYNHVF